jgi:hypothetical protein
MVLLYPLVVGLEWLFRQNVFLGGLGLLVAIYLCGWWLNSCERFRVRLGR